MTEHEIPDDILRTRLEAILFATDQPVSAGRLADALRTTEGKVRVLVHDLAAHYDADGRAFTVEEIAGGFQILTRSDYAGVVKQLYQESRKHRLSQAALETLAIVAYKQPVIRAEVEDIRGVQVGEVLRNLVELGLVRIVGRSDALGRPMLSGTTKKFLVQFGLKSAKDLPPIEDLRKKE
ncbi:MAG TPA: SMC-Scp complex subunit ScpB [Planctomycetota bacterium]|nr:SMC-Scp complex subunit ScpB [Planctomycetota bacterium]